MIIMQEDAEKRPGGAHEGSLCADLRCARCAPPPPPSFPPPTRPRGVGGAPSSPRAAP
eukprot:COSAG01_NODE_7136_length_3338_cov_7.143078_1_plen_57_part_10